MINVIVVSAIVVRAPLSFRQRHCQSLPVFFSAAQYYTIPTLLILLLEVYVKYDVTVVSVDYEGCVIRTAIFWAVWDAGWGKE